ncbi:hypothetical protein KA012_01340 [Candidatus Woesebacteria bacterium]|nr:hypothetical protein [Candidatus Woesebacteria bacterium]
MTSDIKLKVSSHKKHWLFSPLATAGSLILLLVIILRIPSFVEPYWYGDEGIYLTIGTAMNNGAVLYKDIIDHKTPLIYYFARVGSQLSFRILLTVWMATASLAFFAILHRLTHRVWLSTGFASLFVIFTSLPFLEGNIPNGELFVMGFALVGLWVFLRTDYGLDLLTKKAVTSSKLSKPSKSSLIYWVVAGCCMGGAILSKVPALFDAGALFLIGWLAGWDAQLAKGWRFNGQWWRQVLISWGFLAFGVAAPVLLSILYFISIGAGKEYLDFGLLYNFHYVQNWSIGHLPAWGQLFFTLPVKAAIVALALIKLTLLGKWIARPVRWATGWFYLALFASILSNRPYPHYFLQVIPPLLLTIALVTHELTAIDRESVKIINRLFTFAAAVTSVLVMAAVWYSLRIGHYPVVSYYESFINVATKKTTPVEYRNSFNSYLDDNYAASEILKSSSEKKIFIWGTNPMLYALSGKQPVGKFTVAFHIQDLNRYQETIDAVRTELPQYIVVMKGESIVLPGLDNLLRSKYLKNRTFDHFTVWSRRSVTLPSQQRARR